MSQTAIHLFVHIEQWEVEAPLCVCEPVPTQAPSIYLSCTAAKEQFKHHHHFDKIKAIDKQ